MYRFVVYLLQPYTLLYLLTLLGIGNLWRKRRESRTRLLIVTIPFAALTILGIPAVGTLALGSLEWIYPPLQEDPAKAGAIVVLSGGMAPPDATRSRAELYPDTLYRCLHAAEVYRRGPPRPVLVSGGKVDPRTPGPPLAEAMRDILVELGVRSPDIILEDRSRTTYENARESAGLLRGRGIRKVILVTDAASMVRAVGVFRKQGIETIPSGCRYRASRFDLSLFGFLPSPDAIAACQEAFHEWLGVAWYRLRGWI